MVVILLLLAAFYYRLWQVLALLCTLFCTFLSTNATLLQK